MSFDSINSLVELSTDSTSFAQVVKNIELKNSRLTSEQADAKMKLMWMSMLGSVQNYDGTIKSRSGLTGGDGQKYAEYASKCNPITGSFMSRVMTYALEVAESNACMKRIVASPTAGSCGVLPAVLVPLYEDGTYTQDQIIESLYVAAGIGQVIANRASIAGAQGGCQAEIGAASAMAAGTLVYLRGGSPDQIAASVGYALQNLLGLVCDPVAGLVEVPCVKRNVIGAMNACSAADMALAGLVPKIPCDEVIDAMKKVGDKMDTSLKETGLGGVAGTPTAKSFKF